VAQRPKHQDSQIESVLNEAEGHGWSVTYSNGKFTCRCACGSHGHSIRQTKQQWRAAKNLRSQLMTCWH